MIIFGQIKVCIVIKLGTKLIFISVNTFLDRDVLNLKAPRDGMTSLTTLKIFVLSISLNQS